MVQRNKCMDCEERHVGCHITCESYKAFRLEMEAIRKAKDANLVADSLSYQRVVQRNAFYASRKQRGRYKR